VCVCVCVCVFVVVVVFKIKSKAPMAHKMDTTFSDLGTQRGGSKIKK
jgi:hypothetical protein